MSDQSNNVRLAPKTKSDDVPNLPLDIIESQEFQETTLPADTQLKRSALLAMKQKGIKNFTKSSDGNQTASGSTAVDFGDFASDDDENGENQNQNQGNEDDDDFIDVGSLTDEFSIFADILSELSSQMGRSATWKNFQYDMDDNKKNVQSIWNSADEVDPYYVRDVNGETAMKSLSIFEDFKHFEAMTQSSVTQPPTATTAAAATTTTPPAVQSKVIVEDVQDGDEDMPDLLDIFALEPKANLLTADKTKSDVVSASNDDDDDDLPPLDGLLLDDEDMPSLDDISIASQSDLENDQRGSQPDDWLVDIALPNANEQTTTQLNQQDRQERLTQLIQSQRQREAEQEELERRLNDPNYTPEQGNDDDGDGEEETTDGPTAKYISGQTYTKPAWDATTQSNKFDFRHNVLPLGCSVYGPARFERESDNSTSLVLQPGSYLRLTPNFSGRNVKRGFYLITMEIYFEGLPDNTITLSTTDVGRGGAAEAIMTREGSVGFQGGDLSSTRIRPNTWERLALSIDPNIKMRYDNAFIATMNGKLSLVSKDPNGLLNEKGLLRDRLFLFGSHKPAFMDRTVRIKSISLQPRALTQHDISTPDSNAIYSPYQAQLVSNNVKLYQNMSLASFFSKPPPVWQFPLFASLLTDTSQVGDAYYHAIPHTAFYIWSHLLQQTAEAQHELFPTVISPHTTLPNDPNVPQQTLYHKNIGHVTQLLTQISSMYLDCAMFMKIHPLTTSAPISTIYVKKVTERVKALGIGESTIVPFLLRHNITVPSSASESEQTQYPVQTPILFVIEAVTASTACLTLINPFIDDGGKYHELSGAATQQGHAFTMRPTISAIVSLQHLTSQVPWFAVQEAIFNSKDTTIPKIDTIYFTILPLLFQQSYEGMLLDAQTRQMEYTKYQLVKAKHNITDMPDQFAFEQEQNRRFADLEFYPVTSLGSTNQLLLYTTEFIFRRFSFSPLQAQIMTLCLKLRTLDMVYNDLSYITVINPSEVYSIKSALRHVANFTTTCLQSQTNQALAHSGSVVQSQTQHEDVGLDDIDTGDAPSGIINVDKTLKTIEQAIKLQNEINHHMLPLTTRQLFMIYRGLNRITKELKTQKITSFSNENQTTLLLDDGGKSKMGSQYALFPNADRFVLDEAHEKLLSAEQDAIISFDLLDLPQGVKTYGDLIYVLRKTLDICVTLRTQRNLIKNAQLLARSFVLHIFTNIIPVPMSPFGTSEYDRSQSMYFQPASSSQIVDIFTHIYSLFKVLMVLFLNGCQTPEDLSTRERDGSHGGQYMSHLLGINDETDRDHIQLFLDSGYEVQLVAGVLFAILDFVTHKAPSDVRSPLAEILTIGKFGLKLTDWSTVTRGILFYSPESAIVRSKVIEYFERNQPHIKPYLSLELDGGLVGPEYEQIYNSLRLAAGLQPSECVDFNSIFDFERDIAYFQYPHLRSIVCSIFCFRLLALRPQSWAISIQNERHYSTSSSIHNLNLGNYFNVSYYRGNFSMYLHPITVPSLSKANRPVYASYTDADFVVNEYCYNIHKKTTGNTTPYVPTPIRTEDDILHLKNLPTFDGTLSQQDSELLLSYLTTPYLKIPLLLAFFASNDRCHALKNHTLRQILLTSLFEQGRLIYQYNNASTIDQGEVQQSADENGVDMDASTAALLASPQLNTDFYEIVPAQVPAEQKSMISTHYGYLFNELIHNPELLVQNLKLMLESSFELDIGTVHSHGTVIILYIVRIIAHVHTYVRWILTLNNNKNPLYPNFSSLHGLILNPLQKSRLEGQEKVLQELTQHTILHRLTVWVTQLFSEVHLELAAKQFAHQTAEQFINQARSVLSNAQDADGNARDLSDDEETSERIQKKVESIVGTTANQSHNRYKKDTSAITMPNAKSSAKKIRSFAPGLDYELMARLEKSGVIEKKQKYHWMAPSKPGASLEKFNSSTCFYEFEDHRPRAANKSTRKRAVVKSLNENTLVTETVEGEDAQKDEKEELADEDDGNDTSGLKLDGEFVTATLQLSCTIHAHILCILRNRDILDNHSALLILGSTMYLTTHYSFKYQTLIKHEELFRIIHHARRTLITIINTFTQQPLNLFMDQIIRIATGLAPVDAAVLVDYLQKDSNYTPPKQHHYGEEGLPSYQIDRKTIDPDFLPADHPLYAQMMPILQRDMELTNALTQDDPFAGEDDQNEALLGETKAVKLWGLVPGTRGRWISLKDEVTMTHEEYKEFYFSTPSDLYDKALDCEVNLQSLSISVRNATMQALPSAIEWSEPWSQVYGKMMQAALVEQTNQYQAYRIVGSSIDVIRYLEQRKVVPHIGSRQYVPADLPKTERWICGLFEPVRLEYLNDPWKPLVFYLEDTPNLQSDVITIQACTSRRLEPVFEIKVFKSRKIVHVYKYVLYHAKIYTELVYTTNFYHCLADISWNNTSIAPRDHMYHPWNRHETEFPEVPNRLDTISVVIKRAKSEPENLSNDNELYIPQNLLRGVIPQSLLSAYHFWQDSKGNLRGYARANVYPPPTPFDYADFVIYCELITVDRVDSTGKKGSCFHVTKVPLEVMKQRLRDMILLANGLKLPSLSKMPTFCSNPSLTEQKSLDETPSMLLPPGLTAVSSEITATGKAYDGSAVPEGMSYSLDQLQIIPPSLQPQSSSTTVTSSSDKVADDLKKRAGITGAKKFKQNKNAESDANVVYELVNFLHAPRGSAAYQIASVLTRVESLAQLLPWVAVALKNNNTSVALNGAHVVKHHSDISNLDIHKYQPNTQIAHAFDYAGTASKNTLDADVDTELQRQTVLQRTLPYFIEIPSLQISFESKFNQYNELQLYSVDHNDLYISNTRTPQLTTLTRALPHALVMQSLHNDISILVPAFEIFRPIIRDSPYSTEVVITRSYRSLCDGDTSYFLYQVHTSHSFMFVPTLASALYLLVAKFFAREYSNVIKLLNSVNSDVAFTPLESNIFALLGSVHNTDVFIPDALACMLRISLATLSASKTQPWSLGRALPLYSGFGLHNFSSTVTKVPIEDELSLLRMLLTDDVLQEALAFAARSYMHIGFNILATYNRYSYLTSLIYSLPSFKVLTPPNCTHKSAFHTTTLPPVEELISWYITAMSSITNLRDVPGYTINPPILPLSFTPTNGQIPSIPSGTISIASRGANGAEEVELSIPLHIRHELPKKTRYKCNVSQISQKFQFIGTLTPQSANHILTRAVNDSALSPSGWGFLLAYMLLTGDTMYKMNNVDCAASLGATLTMLFRDHTHSSPFNYILRLLIERPELVPFFPKFTSFKSLTFLRANHREASKIDIGLFLLMATRSIVRLYVLNPDLVRLSKSLPPLGAPKQQIKRYIPPSQTVPIILAHKLRPKNAMVVPDESITGSQTPQSSRFLTMISQFSSLQTVMQHRFDPPKLTDTDCNMRVSVDFHVLAGLAGDATSVNPHLKAVLQSLLDQESAESHSHEGSPRITKLTQLQSQPISTLDIDQFIVDVTRVDKNLPPLSEILPFDLGPHPAAQTTVAISMRDRLEKDIQVYAKQSNSSIDSLFLSLSNVTEIRALIQNPTGAKMFKSLTLLSKLHDQLLALRTNDAAFISLGQKVINVLTNNVSLPPQYNNIVESLFSIKHTCFSTEKMTLGVTQDQDDAEALQRLYFLLSKVGEQSSEIDFDYVIGSFISSRSVYDLLKINPFIPPQYVTLVYSLVEFILLRTNRIAHINRTLFEISDLQTILNRLRNRAPITTEVEIAVTQTEIMQKSKALVASISSKRHYYSKMSQEQFESMKDTLKHDDNIAKIWHNRSKKHSVTTTSESSQISLKHSPNHDGFSTVSTSPLLSAGAYFSHNPLIMEHIARTVQAAVFARDAEIFRTYITNDAHQVGGVSTTGTILKNANVLKQVKKSKKGKVSSHILNNQLLVDPLCPIQPHPLKANCLLRDRVGFLLNSSQRRAAESVKQRWARLEAGQDAQHVENPLYEVLYNTPAFVPYSYRQAKRGKYGLSTYARTGITTEMLNALDSQSQDITIFDPRYLVFEFNFSILLRKSQVSMINDFVEAIQNGQSKVVQLLMGAGKTTCICPLLCILLSVSKENSYAQYLSAKAQREKNGQKVDSSEGQMDGQYAGMDKLIVSVVPNALLEFSRSVMRSSFSSVIVKKVITFTFDRQTPATYELLQKLKHAASSRSVVIATPTSLKSVMLKYLELQYNISKPELRNRDENTTSELHILSEILQLFKRSLLLIDEVDQVLHTLKSEINFPIAERVELDFSPLRWTIAQHCLSSILHCDSGVVPHQFAHSKRAHSILAGLRSTIEYGYRKNYLQAVPHLVLLNEDFYLNHLRPHVIDWVILFIDGQHIGSTVTHKHLKDYFESSTLDLSIEKHDDDPYLSSRVISPETVELVSLINSLPPHHVKLLNLARDWIRSYLPHIMTKISRVHFGLLSPQDLVIALANDPFMPATRQKLVVPFSGRDQPAQSEFACSEVIIGLTYVSYLREGLRYSDFVEIIDMMRNNLLKELGAFSKRPTAVLYDEWVQSAGGVVLGHKNNAPTLDNDDLQTQLLHSILNEPEDIETEKNNNNDTDETDPAKEKAIEVVSLRLLKRTNHQQMDLLFKLWQKHGPVIEWYLDTLVFPQHLRHQNIKLSASGVDLGSDLLFSRRIGFSGTPSDLLPTDLGKCQYEPGSDGKIISTLTDPSVAQVVEIGHGWTVKSLLNLVAKARTDAGDMRYHCLIDTGALITGISNVDVAKHLLENGLGDFIDGVVYLDKEDRKMVLLKANFKSVPIEQCGVPPTRRFAFYDQIHCIGIDIGHRLNAHALLTLGKDMVFRDISQGAWRLRKIGEGQTLDILLIPEMKSLLDRKLAPVEQDKVVVEDGVTIHHKNVLLKPLESTLKEAQKSAPFDAHLISQSRQLTRVIAFLVINSMITERVQFVQLCTQNCTNVWKKGVFAQLLKRGVGYYTFARFPENEEYVKRQLEREKQQHTVVTSKFLSSIAPLENRDRKRYRLLISEFKKIQKQNKSYERKKKDKLRLNQFFQQTMAVYNVHFGTQLKNLAHYRHPSTCIRKVMTNLREFLHSERKKFIAAELKKRRLMQSMRQLDKSKSKKDNKHDEDDDDDDDDESSDDENEELSDDEDNITPQLPLLSSYIVGFKFDLDENNLAINADPTRSTKTNLAKIVDSNPTDGAELGEYINTHEARLKNNVEFETKFFTNQDEEVLAYADEDTNRDDQFEQLLFCFIEDISAPIPDSVPKFVPFSKSLEQRLLDNSHFLRGDLTLVNRCQQILGLLKSTAQRVEEYHLNSEMVQEAMEERTKELENDQEQLIEVEKYVDVVYDRAHEKQSPWIFDLLANEIASQNQLYHANQFSVMSLQNHIDTVGVSDVPNPTLSAKFPDQLYLSHNYFNMTKGVGHARRLKNIIMYLDLIPSLSKLTPFAGHELSTLNDKFGGEVDDKVAAQTKAFLAEVKKYSHELEIVIKTTILLGLCEQPSQTVVMSDLVSENATLPYTSSIIPAGSTLTDLLTVSWEDCQLTRENVNTILQLLTQRKNMHYHNISSPTTSLDDSHIDVALLPTTTTIETECSIDLALFFPAPTSVAQSFTQTISAREFINTLATSTILSQGENHRYSVILSLAEAETIRRIIHAKEEIAIHRFLKIKAREHRQPHRLNLPAVYTPFSPDIMKEIPSSAVISGSDTEFSLRCMPFNGISLGATSNFKQSAFTQFYSTLQLLRFINNEAHFSDPQLHLLVQLLDGNNIKNVFDPQSQQNDTNLPPLIQFFTSLLGARRRLQAQWASTPIKTVLVTPSRFVLLKIATLSHLLKQFISLNDVQILSMYSWMDMNSDAKISPGEFYRCLQFIYNNMYRYCYSRRVSSLTKSVQAPPLEPDLTVSDHFLVTPLDLMQLFLSVLPLTTIASTKAIMGHKRTAPPASSSTGPKADAPQDGTTPSDSGSQSFSLGFKELCQIVKVSEDDDDEEEEEEEGGEAETVDPKTTLSSLVSPTSPVPGAVASPTPIDIIPLIELDTPYPSEVFQQLLSNVSIYATPLPHATATTTTNTTTPAAEQKPEAVVVVEEPKQEETEPAKDKVDDAEKDEDDETEEEEDADEDTEGALDAIDDDDDADAPRDTVESEESSEKSEDTTEATPSTTVQKQQQQQQQQQQKKKTKKAKKDQFEVWEQPTFEFLAEKCKENSSSALQLVPETDDIIFNFTTPELPPGCTVLGDAKFVKNEQCPEESYWEVDQFSAIVVTPLIELPSPFRSVRVSNISFELAVLAPEPADSKSNQYNAQAVVSGDARAIYQLEDCKNRLAKSIYCHEKNVDQSFWVDPNEIYLTVSQDKLNDYLEFNTVLEEYRTKHPEQFANKQNLKNNLAIFDTVKLNTSTQPKDWPLDLIRTAVHFHSLTAQSLALEQMKSKLKNACGKEVWNYQSLVDRINSSTHASAEFQFLLGLYAPSSSSILGSGSSADFILTSKGVQFASSVDHSAASFFQDETKFNIVSVTSVYHQHSNYGETKLSIGLAKILHLSQTCNFNHSPFSIGGTGDVSISQGKTRIRKIVFHQNPDLPLDITAKQLVHFKSYVDTKVNQPSSE